MVAVAEAAAQLGQCRYADGVVALSKAVSLASANDEARAIREEVGFFQAIRAALIKSIGTSGRRSAAERELAIQQIVSRAVVSTEIVDIMRGAGLESPDISILSDEEIAFYDALAENDSAGTVMGEPALRVIAHELVTSMKGSISVD